MRLVDYLFARLFACLLELCVCSFVRLFICCLRACTLARLHACTLARLHACMLARLQACKLARLNACMLACSYACIFAHLHACVATLANKATLSARRYSWPCTCPCLSSEVRVRAPLSDLSISSCAPPRLSYIVYLMGSCTFWTKGLPL
jgi:hypothetical protein